MYQSNAANLPPAADEKLFGSDDFNRLLDGQVIYFTAYGSNWQYGIVSFTKNPEWAEVCAQVTDEGVHSSYTVWPMRKRFRFRLARPSEYVNLEFSYDHTPTLASEAVALSAAANSKHLSRRVMRHLRCDS